MGKLATAFLVLSLGSCAGSHAVGGWTGYAPYNGHANVTNCALPGWGKHRPKDFDCGTSQSGIVPLVIPPGKGHYVLPACKASRRGGARIAGCTGWFPASGIGMRPTRKQLEKLLIRLSPKQRKRFLREFGPYLSRPSK